MKVVPFSDIVRFRKQLTGFTGSRLVDKFYLVIRELLYCDRDLIAIDIVLIGISAVTPFSFLNAKCCNGYHIHTIRTPIRHICHSADHT